MTPSLVFWCGAAVLLFWSVGAYNRLVRLRSEANGAFAALDAELARQVRLVQDCLPHPDSTQPAPLMSEHGAIWVGLQGAAAQCHATLATVRTAPLDADGIAALSAARDVLSMAWERVERDDSHDLAGPRLPETVTAARLQLTAQTQAAVEHFNRSVQRYNDAIGQFPALLLAWLCGFKPGRRFGAGGGPDGG